MGTDPVLIGLPEELHGERVVVRPFCATDAPSLWEAVDESRARLRTWLPWADGYRGPDDARAYVARAQARWLLREDLSLGIFARADGALLGGCGLHRIDWALRTFHIGYWVRARAQGLGYASEAVRLLAAMAFDRLDACRVALHIDPRNARSLRVTERCGFRHEGVLRQAGLGDGGGLRPADASVWSLLPDEYRALPWARGGQAPAPAPDQRTRLRGSAVLLDDAGCVALVRQHASDFWVLPGGGAEPGELTREAAVREVREETGLLVVCERLIWMLEEVHHLPGRVRHHLNACYLARVTGRADAPAEHEWGYFARTALPANVGLPPDFWTAADRGFRPDDPGERAVHHRAPDTPLKDPGPGASNLSHT